MQHPRSFSSRFLPIVLPLLVLSLLPSAWAQTTPAAEKVPAASQAQLDQEFAAKLEQINGITKARQVSVDELQARMKKGEKIVVLDVREPQEREVSSLPGSRLAVPDQVRTMALSDIPADATVVTYCTAGYRSGMAAVILEERLGRPVYSLNGGIIDWYNRGGTVVDPSGKPVNRVDAVEEPWTSYVHPR